MWSEKCLLLQNRRKPLQYQLTCWTRSPVLQKFFVFTDYHFVILLTLTFSLLWPWSRLYYVVQTQPGILFAAAAILPRLLTLKMGARTSSETLVNTKAFPSDFSPSSTCHKNTRRCLSTSRCTQRFDTKLICILNYYINCESYNFKDRLVTFVARGRRYRVTFRHWATI
jgi:hypothetical protein